MSNSVLDIYLLSLIDRGFCTKYDLQRRGGVSLGSSTPALKRLQNDGLITEHQGDDGTMRIRHILKLTSRGRRIVRQDWRIHFDKDAELDLEAILRVLDIASYAGATKKEIVGFLDAMARKRTEILVEDQSPEPIVLLQRQWSADRAKAEARFIANVAKSFGRSKPTSATKQARAKVRSHP